MGEVEYYPKRTGIATFELAKFEGGSLPVTVYHLLIAPGRAKCDCPAWQTGRTRPCKHLLLLRIWLDAGEPIPIPFREEKI